jgi:hypothetical protein
MTRNTRPLGKRAGDKNAGSGHLEQDSWRKWGWYRQNKKERTGWPAHERRTGQLGQDN